MNTRETSAMRKLAAHQTTPGWAREILEASAASNGSAVTSAEIGLHTIDSSYLDFLRDQIELSPRGPEWSHILSARLEALRSVIGEPLFRIGVRKGESMFIGQVRASDLEVVYTEECD